MITIIFLTDKEKYSEEEIAKKIVELIKNSKTNNVTVVDVAEKFGISVLLAKEQLLVRNSQIIKLTKKEC